MFKEKQSVLVCVIWFNQYCLFRVFVCVMYLYFTAADAKSLGTAYFILKSFNPEDISISQTKGIWATQPHNEVVLNKAFEVCIILHTLYCS